MQAVDHGDYIYFFFREMAVEYNTMGKVRTLLDACVVSSSTIVRECHSPLGRCGLKRVQQQPAKASPPPCSEGPCLLPSNSLKPWAASRSSLPKAEQAASWLPSYQAASCRVGFSCFVFLLSLSCIVGSSYQDSISKPCLGLGLYCKTIESSSRLLFCYS